jgi:hypothetical protein
MRQDADVIIAALKHRSFTTGFVHDASHFYAVVTLTMRETLALFYPKLKKLFEVLI